MEVRCLGGVAAALGLPAGVLALVALWAAAEVELRPDSSKWNVTVRSLLGSGKFAGNGISGESDASVGSGEALPTDWADLSARIATVRIFLGSGKLGPATEV